MQLADFDLIDDRPVPAAAPAHQTPAERPNPKAKESTDDIPVMIKRLDMALPGNKKPENEGDYEMLDRVKRWEEQFKSDARRALREVYGYKDAAILDFRWLGMDAGHDENDYELVVQFGGSNASTGKVGNGEGISTVKIVVRRVTDTLQS